jgi:hypothetical protein
MSLPAMSGAARIAHMLKFERCSSGVIEPVAPGSG